MHWSRKVMIVISPALLSACSIGVLAPAGPVGRSERTILFNSLAIMLAIVIPTIVATLAFAWWFRASNSRARYRPQFAYSGRIELIVWSIPTLVILFLSGVIWIGSHQLDPARPLPATEAPLEVQVVALDWKWLFLYPEQRIASVNELVLPAARPVHFSVTSASVMNQFFVPQLGGMIAAMNRMVTHLHMQADAPGQFYGMSAQFSGDGFSDMHFNVRAVTAAEFAQWSKATGAAGPMLDRAAYRQLSLPSQNVAPRTYREVDPALFAAIVGHGEAPAPGPNVERAHSQNSSRGPH